MLARRHKNAATLAANVPTRVVQINGEQRVFHLRAPIDLDERWDQGHCLLSYAPLGLTAYGDTEAEAYSGFAEVFEATWEQIAESPDRQLDSRARELKMVLRKLVRLIESPRG